MAADPKDALVLKVMRLRRPTLEVPGAPGFAEGAPMPKLMLPMSLTQSFVGESFTGYLHIANPISVPISSVTLRVELQIGSSKLVLFNNASNPVDSIAPGEFFDATVDYVLRDQGTYILTCYVSFTPPGAPAGEPPGLLKRSYRFPALLPFAVVHRAAQLDSQLLVECAVENATGSNIYLASSSFEAAPGFRAALVRAGAEEVPLWGSGSEMHLLKPRGAHSLLFRVIPEDDSGDTVARARALDLVGTLALGWHVPDGPSGVMEGHQVRVRPLPSATGLDLRVTSCPGRVRVEEPFRLEVEVVNRVAQAAEPSLVLDPRLMGVVRAHGVTQYALGRLEPNASMRIPLDLLVTAPGLHALQGVSVVDSLSSARTEPQVLCDILAF
mmetsp:Transcript_151787/g.487038  ORF Transcript_151787/g.487038 Transcript_151787/m.487038 type:complete len:384 (+) Transcript_151787:84-1235(+)